MSFLQHHSGQKFQGRPQHLLTLPVPSFPPSPAAECPSGLKSWQPRSCRQIWACDTDVSANGGRTEPASISGSTELLTMLFGFNSLGADPVQGVAILPQQCSVKFSVSRVKLLKGWEMFWHSVLGSHFFSTYLREDTVNAFNLPYTSIHPIQFLNI